MDNYYDTGYSPNTLLELHKRRHELLATTHDSNLFAQKVAEIVLQHLRKKRKPLKIENKTNITHNVSFKFELHIYPLIHTFAYFE